MMPEVDRIIHARHIAYIPTDIFDDEPTGTGSCDLVDLDTGIPLHGTPIVRPLSPAICKVTSGVSSLPEFPGARHIGYTPGGTPIVAGGWACCDATGWDEYVEEVCWPIGEGPGITDQAWAYAVNVNSCLSATNQQSPLTYDPGSGKWLGSLSLRGGTLNLAFSCDPAEPTTSPEKFLLEWTGCETGSQRAGYQCTDPLVVTFGAVGIPDCCDCGTGHTSEEATIAITVVANCRKVCMARHVSYTPSGIPIVARDRLCDWHGKRKHYCTDLQCGLVAEVTGTDSGTAPGTADGDCSCFDGTYDMDFGPGLGGSWLAVSFPSCPHVSTMRMTCTNSGCGKWVTLRLTVECGATNTGSDEVTVLAEEMENLDVTFNIEMADPASGCSGTCTFQWNEMANSWSMIDDNCVASGASTCECVDSLTLPPGSVDGETMEVACEGEGDTPCCIGTLQVRVMR